MNVEEVVIVNRPADELYRCWRNFEQLRSFMQHILTVRQLDHRRLHWVAMAPAGRTVQWDAEIINEIPNPSFVITHRLPIDDAPRAYPTFRDHRTCIKVVLKPHEETVH